MSSRRAPILTQSRSYRRCPRSSLNNIGVVMRRSQMFTHASLGAKPAAALRTWDQRDLRHDERAVCDDKTMTESQDNPLGAYVRAPLALQGYTFDEAAIAEIVMQFSRPEVVG